MGDGLNTLHAFFFLTDADTSSNTKVPSGVNPVAEDKAISEDKITKGDLDQIDQSVSHLIFDRAILDYWLIVVYRTLSLASDPTRVVSA